MDFQRIEILVAVLTGVIALVLQIWSRYDESRRDKKMVNLDERRFVIDESRSDTEIMSQQSDVHIRATEALSREITNLSDRLDRITEQAMKDREELRMIKSSLEEFFDMVEQKLSNGHSETDSQESKNLSKIHGPIIKAIRQLRREYSI